MNPTLIFHLVLLLLISGLYRLVLLFEFFRALRRVAVLLRQHVRGPLDQLQKEEGATTRRGHDLDATAPASAASVTLIGHA